MVSEVEFEPTPPFGIAFTSYFLQKVLSVTGQTGAQPALHFRWGAIFMKFHLMMSSCLFNHGTPFSQMITDKVLFARFLKLRTF